MRLVLPGWLLVMYNNNVSPSPVSQDTEGDTEWEGRRSKLSDQHKKHSVPETGLSQQEEDNKFIFWAP